MLRKRKKNCGISRKTDTPLEKALSLYQIRMPYSMDELKQTRNNLIKQYHPDIPGGSVDACAEVTTAYAILKKFAD